MVKIDFDLNTAPKPKNYLWEFDDEDLPEWDKFK